VTGWAVRVCPTLVMPLWQTGWARCHGIRIAGHGGRISHKDRRSKTHQPIMTPGTRLGLAVRALGAE